MQLVDQYGMRDNKPYAIRTDTNKFIDYWTIQIMVIDVVQ
jgi:hypothetical protein